MVAHRLPTAADLPVDEQHDEQADQDEQHPRNQRNEPGLAAQLLKIAPARSSSAENCSSTHDRQGVEGEEDGGGGGTGAQGGVGHAADEVDRVEGEICECQGGDGGRDHEVSVYRLYTPKKPVWANVKAFQTLCSWS